MLLPIRVRKCVKSLRMEMNTPQRVAKEINHTRIQSGLTVIALATKSGIPLTTLQRRFDGDGNITLGEIEKLSTALDVTVASWFPSAA